VLASSDVIQFCIMWW